MATLTSERIKDARKAKNLSMEALAKLISVSKGTISHWESGDNTPTKDNLAALAKALDRQEAWLAGYSSEEAVTLGFQKEALEAPLMAAISLDWGTAFRVAKLLINSQEAKALSETAMAETMKRCYVVAFRDPSKLTEALIADTALSYI